MKRFEIIYLWPLGDCKYVCVWKRACMYVCMIMSLGPVCETWNDASSDITRRRRWWRCGHFLRGLKSTHISCSICGSALGSEQESGHTSFNRHNTIVYASLHLIDNAPALRFKFKLYELSQTCIVISNLLDRKMGRSQTLWEKSSTAQRSRNRSSKTQVSILANDPQWTAHRRLDFICWPVSFSQKGNKGSCKNKEVLECDNKLRVNERKKQTPSLPFHIYALTVMLQHTVIPSFMSFSNLSSPPNFLAVSLVLVSLMHSQNHASSTPFISSHLFWWSHAFIDGNHAPALSR